MSKAHHLFLYIIAVCVRARARTQVQCELCLVYCSVLTAVPDSFVCGIFQTRILEWVAISYSRGSSLLQGIFPTQGSNLCLLCVLRYQVDSLILCHLGSLYSHKELLILVHFLKTANGFNLLKFFR